MTELAAIDEFTITIFNHTQIAYELVELHLDHGKMESDTIWYVNPSFGGFGRWACTLSDSPCGFLTFAEVGRRTPVMMVRFDLRQPSSFGVCTVPIDSNMAIHHEPPHQRAPGIYHAHIELSNRVIR